MSFIDTFLEQLKACSEDVGGDGSLLVRLDNDVISFPKSVDGFLNMTESSM